MTPVAGHQSVFHIRCGPVPYACTQPYNTGNQARIAAVSLREGTGTSRSAAQQWHAARGMQNLAKQPKDDHATSLGQNRSAPCIRGRQCAPRRSGAAIRQHRGGIPLGSRSKCGVRPRAASAMVPRGGHRLNEPVVGEVGGRGGGGPDPLHPETPPFSKRVRSEETETEHKC